VNKKQLACLPHVKPENGFLDRKTGRQDGEDLQERLWLLFDIAQIISNTSDHKQIILCVLCALCG
jgi:hypothetical protein